MWSEIEFEEETEKDVNASESMTSLLGQVSPYLLAGLACYTAHENGLLFPIVKISLAFGAVAVSLLLYNQAKILYVPVIDPVAFPRKNQFDPWTFHDQRTPFETIEIKASDGVQLHGWFLKQHSEGKTRAAWTMLYFHGNAGNIGHRLPLYHFLMQELGINIVAAEYRGYGESHGEPSEAGLKRDALAFYQYALDHEKINKDKIIIFGRSLGGAVGLHLVHELHQLKATTRKDDKSFVLPKALIIENTFLGIPDIATVLLPFLKPFRPLLHAPILTNNWLNREIVHELTDVPVMFISGRKDELIPPAHMDELWTIYMKSALVPLENKQKSIFYPVAKGTHNDTPGVAGKEYYVQLGHFLSKL